MNLVTGWKSLPARQFVLAFKNTAPSIRKERNVLVFRRAGGRPL